MTTATARPPATARPSATGTASAQDPDATGVGSAQAGGAARDCAPASAPLPVVTGDRAVSPPASSTSPVETPAPREAATAAPPPRATFAAADTDLSGDDDALHRAIAAWEKGDVDAAGAAIDPLPGGPGDPVHDRAAGIAASVWAARGLPAMSRAVYRAAAPSSRSPFALAVAISAGDTVAATAPTSPIDALVVPTALTVALEHFDRGLRESLATDCGGALHDLVRAAEMYSAAGVSEPVPELPAVVAALVALGLGELTVAARVLDDAIAAHHGGAWAHEHLVLWRAWTALQAQQLPAVADALDSIAEPARPLDARDRLLADALRVGLARRTGDETRLRVAWDAAGAGILRSEPDVFAALPLGELAIAAARLGETGRARDVLESTRSLAERLGAPPVWTAALDWAGIQQGILSNSPAALTPHARALVAAAPHSRVCAVMARAGRVWTSVLAGDVDPTAVEVAAHDLAAIGLAWDASRLAGHGAARSDDRRTVARLLACARLHNPPPERSAPASDAVSPNVAADGLSTREREVAVLVLQGLTYAEIGEAIFISPRTAEHHIARIRQRLGATSRSDLIAKLRHAMDDPHQPVHRRSRT